MQMSGATGIHGFTIIMSACFITYIKYSSILVVVFCIVPNFTTDAFWNYVCGINYALYVLLSNAYCKQIEIEPSHFS